MLKTYKYRIYLSKGQKRLLEQQLELCRSTYNQLLATKRDLYEQEKISLRKFDLLNLLPGMKEDRPELKHVHSMVLQNIGVRVHLAFESFFRRVQAKGKEVGFPRFKSFGRYDSMTYPQYGNGAEVRGNDLILSKIGRVKVVWHRAWEGIPKTVTVRRSSTGKWYVSFACEIEAQKREERDQAVGIDLGLESFFTTNTGFKLPNPRFFRKEEHDLQRVQRRLSAAEKGTPERRKQRGIVARIHERIKHKREDFCHKVSRTLVNRYGLIVFEDLDVKRMILNHKLAKSIADASWSTLVQYTHAKAEEAGRVVVTVNPAYTSQWCSDCGTLVKKDLGVRVHVCPECGLTLDRDENAARNILRLGLQALSG